MKTLIKNEFRQTRKTLLIWLGIMLLLCGFCYFELLSLKDSLDEMARTCFIERYRIAGPK